MLHGLPVDGEMECVDSELGQGTELGFLGPVENSIDCIVHGVTKNQTGLSDFH